MESINKSICNELDINNFCANTKYIDTTIILLEIFSMVSYNEGLISIIIKKAPFSNKRSISITGQKLNDGTNYFSGFELDNLSKIIKDSIINCPEHRLTFAFAKPIFYSGIETKHLENKNADHQNIVQNFSFFLENTISKSEVDYSNLSLYGFKITVGSIYKEIIEYIQQLDYVYSTFEKNNYFYIQIYRMSSSYIGNINILNKVQNYCKNYGFPVQLCLITKD